MKVSYIEAVIQGMNTPTKVLVDSLSDVPEPFRVDGVPSWAGTYGVKRHVFSILCRFKRVQLWLLPGPDGALHYMVKMPLLKEWSFTLTPELLYLMFNIARSVLQDKAADLLFKFRDRRIFLPYELIVHFLNSMGAVCKLHGGRVASIHEALQAACVEPQPKQDDEDAEPEVKLVLH